MLYDLQQLMPVLDLQCLAQPFSTDEINQIIKDLPLDKAPGPDGFNGHFLKRS